MSVSNGKIIAPVSIDDVKSILGESSNDLATLCKSSKINMWAKYKPTCYPSPFPDDWYRARDDNYGISVPRYNTLESLYNAYFIDGDENHDNGYSYERPSGGSAEPYRLGDFRGYNSRATSPIFSFIVTANATTNEGVSGSCGFRKPSVGEDDRVNLEDIGIMKDCYFGFALFKSGKPVYFRTESNTVSNGSFMVQIGGNGFNLATGNYVAIPFLSTTKYDNNNRPDFVAGSWYPIPTAVPNKVIIETIQNPYLRDLKLSYQPSTKKVTLKNVGSKTYKRIYIDIRFSTSTQTTAFQFGEHRAITNKNIAPNEIITVDIGRYVLLEDKRYKVMLYAENTLVDEILFD
jgi:hypothetical protein